MKNKTQIKSILIIAFLVVFNIGGYWVGKTYFSKNTGEEVEALNPSSYETQNNELKILSWTYELFKSFRESTN
jgi:hypothetical protein